MQSLVANDDDIDGPGNNSYLRYTTAEDSFTVVAWDQNLSFGGRGDAGGGGPGAAAGGGAGRVAGQRPAGAAAVGGGGGARGGNILAERFAQNTDFAAMTTAATADLRAQLYTSGVAQQILDSWTAVLTESAADLVAADVIASEAATVAGYFTA